MIFPLEEYDRRIDGCKSIMIDNGVDTLLVYSDFLRQYNIRYLTGYLYFPSPMSASIFILRLDDEPTLLVDNISSRAIDRIREDSWVKDVRTSKAWLKKPWISGVLGFLIDLSLKTLKEREMSNDRIGVVGLDFMPHIILECLKRAFPRADFVDITEPIERLRMIKSSLEIEIIRRTVKIADAGLKVWMDSLAVGKREYEVGAEVFKEIYSEGVEEIYGFWVRSGPENTRYHGTPRFTARKIRDGDLVWMDMGFSRNGYFADTARSTIVGRANENNRKLCDACLAALEGAFDAMKPGERVADVFEASVEKAKETGLEKYFRVGFWGHGVGVNMDEHPIFAPNEPTVLQPNMVMSIGPKFSAPDFGGVTIEDNILITEKGAEHLNGFERKLW